MSPLHPFDNHRLLLYDKGVISTLISFVQYGFFPKVLPVLQRRAYLKVMEG